MKKILIITMTIIIASFLSSCSKSYTCNTYTQADTPELVKERI